MLPSIPIVNDSSLPPSEQLPNRPIPSRQLHHLRALDLVSRRQLIDIIADLMDCISGPLPPSLINVLLFKSRDDEKDLDIYRNGKISSRKRIDALSDVISSTETEVEELVQRARSFQIPDYSAIIAAHSNNLFVPFSSMLADKRQPFSLPRSLSPIPEDNDIMDEELVCKTPPKLPESPPPLSPLEYQTPTAHQLQYHNPPGNTSPVLPSVLFESAVTGGSPASEGMEIASNATESMTNVPNETYITELSRIELFLNDRLSDNALARFFPSLYIGEMNNSPESAGFKESIPIVIHGTAGYSEDECEVFLRASCIRTGLTGLCRLSQIVPEHGDESDIQCIQLAQTRLWKLHPL